MPRRDGTGPLGRGALTGRGLGVCNVSNAIKRGAGLGLELGFGLGRRGGFRGNIGLNQANTKTPKELLTKQKELLEDKLNLITKQLENL